MNLEGGTLCNSGQNNIGPKGTSSLQGGLPFSSHPQTPLSQYLGLQSPPQTPGVHISYFTCIREHIYDEITTQKIIKPFSIRLFKSLTRFSTGAKHPLPQIDGCKYTRCTRSNDALASYEYFS